MPVSKVCQGIGELLSPIKVSRSAGMPEKSKSIADSDSSTTTTPSVKQNTTVGIRNSHGAQPAEHSIRRPHEGKGNGNPQQRDLDVKHGLNEQRAAVEHRGIKMNRFPSKNNKPIKARIRRSS